MPQEFTKAERRELRDLAGRVYEAEAGHMLKELDAEFERWRTGELLSSELICAIHAFHQHQSRDLWSLYRWLRDPDIVARGVVHGFLPAQAVSNSLRAKLPGDVDSFQERPPGEQA